MKNSEIAMKIAGELISERRARLDARIAELRDDPENDFDDVFLARLRARAIDAIDSGELTI